MQTKNESLDTTHIQGVKGNTKNGKQRLEEKVVSPQSSVHSPQSSVISHQSSDISHQTSVIRQKTVEGRWWEGWKGKNRRQENREMKSSAHSRLFLNYPMQYYQAHNFD